MPKPSGKRLMRWLHVVHDGQQIVPGLNVGFHDGLRIVLYVPWKGVVHHLYLRLRWQWACVDGPYYRTYADTGSWV